MESNVSAVNVNYTVRTINATEFLPDITRVALTAFVLSVSAFGSLIALLLFMLYSSIRTPFNVYIISIILSEMLLVVSGVAHLLTRYSDHNTRSTCALYIGSVFIGGSGVQKGELIISFNRFWAMYFPHHYRQHHGMKTSIYISLAIHAVNAAFFLPIVPWKNQASAPGRCPVNFNILPGYSTFIGVYMNAPLIVLVVIYGVLWYKRRARIVKSHSQVAAYPASNQGSVTGTGTGTGSRAVVQLPKGPTSSQAASRGTPKQRSNKKGERNGFLVLSWVVVCALLFWTPNLLQFIVPSYFRGSSVTSWLLTWSFFGHCIEPWMFLFTIPNFREKLLTKRC